MKYILPLFSCIDHGKYFGSLGRRMTLRPELFGDGRFDGVEFDAYFTGVFRSDWTIDRRRLARLTRNIKNIFTVHACFESPFEMKPLLEFNKLNMAEKSSANETAIKKHVDLVELLVESENGPVVPDKPLLIFHPGRLPKSSDYDKALDNLMHNLELAVDYAAGKPATIGLENLPPVAGDANPERYPFRHLGTSAEELEYVFGKPGMKDRLRLVLDIGHSNVTGETEKLIETLGGKIGHVHASWNNGKWDQGKALPREDDADYDRFIKTLGLLEHARLKNGFDTITVEIWPVFLSDY